MKQSHVTAISALLAAVLGIVFTGGSIATGIAAALFALIVIKVHFFKDAPDLNEADRYFALGTFAVVVVGFWFFGAAAIYALGAGWLGVSIPSLARQFFKF